MRLNLKWILNEVHASLRCTVLRYYSVLLPYSFSVCEQAEKLEVLDHAFSVTSMSASIGQWLCLRIRHWSKGQARTSLDYHLLRSFEPSFSPIVVNSRAISFYVCRKYFPSPIHIMHYLRSTTMGQFTMIAMQWRDTSTIFLCAEAATSRRPE